MVHPFKDYIQVHRKAVTHSSQRVTHDVLICPAESPPSSLSRSPPFPDHSACVLLNEEAAWKESLRAFQTERDTLNWTPASDVIVITWGNIMSQNQQCLFNMSCDLRGPGALWDQNDWCRACWDWGHRGGQLLVLTLIFPLPPQITQHQTEEQQRQEAQRQTSGQQ